MTYYVYQLKTTKCNKYYIGVTNNPERRFKQHCAQENRPWKKLTRAGKAIKRYGADTFSMRILEECETEQEACDLEFMWIKRFGRKRVWNGNCGGALRNKGTRKGVPCSDETKKKLSLAHKGKIVSDETKAKMSKPKTKEHKKNISKAISARNKKLAGTIKLYNIITGEGKRFPTGTVLKNWVTGITRNRMIKRGELDASGRVH